MMINMLHKNETGKMKEREEEYFHVYYFPLEWVCLWKGQRFTKRSSMLLVKYPENPAGVAGGKSSGGMANGRIIFSIVSNVRYEPTSCSLSVPLIGSVCSWCSEVASLFFFCKPYKMTDISYWEKQVRHVKGTCSLKFLAHEV